jgi:hypothetical protein
VAAQADLHRRREPAQPNALSPGTTNAVSATFISAGDVLHPLGGGRLLEQADTGGVAAEGRLANAST